MQLLVVRLAECFTKNFAEGFLGCLGEGCFLECLKETFLKGLAEQWAGNLAEGFLRCLMEAFLKGFDKCLTKCFLGSLIDNSAESLSDSSAACFLDSLAENMHSQASLVALVVEFHCDLRTFTSIFISLAALWS